MKDKLNQTIEGILHERQTRRRYACILLVLALITVLSVNWSLHQQGLSMTADAAQATAETAMDDADGQESEAMLATLDLPDGEYAVDVQRSAEDPASMSGNVTGLSGSGTKYDANGNLFSSDLKLEFNFPADTVTSDNLNYYYEYPDGIIVPDGLLDKKNDLYDGNGKKAGVYYFEKTGDGKYRVRVDFDESYVEANPNADITGYIQFAGQVDGSKADDNGNIKIIGSDNVTLDIPKDQIDYPDNETNRYDIKTTKKGSYNKDGKLTYTVYVYSMKGTPGEIDFEDAINATGLALGTPEVTVKKQTVKKYPNDPDGGGTMQKEETITPADYNYNNDSGELKMTLPQIAPAKHNDAEGGELANDEYTRYEITYTYDVSDIKDTAYVDNKATSASSNGTTEVKSEAKNHVDVKTTVDDNVSKTGVGAGGVDYISWTITVNKNQENIVGAELHDDMLKNLIPGHFTINPDKGYEIEKDSNGNITGIKFKEDGSGTNTNTYTITYRTPAQSDWNNGENGPVSNTVHFKHDDKDESATATIDSVSPVRIDKTVGNATENADGKTVTVEWTVKITVPADKLPKDTVIKDDPTQNRYNNAGGTQYRTRQQALDWANGIYWASYGHDGPVEITDSSLPKLTDSSVATIRFLGSDGKEYTLEDVKASAEDSSLTYTVATITLNKDLETPANATYLMFHYTTTADITQASTSGTNYYNTASIGDKKGDAVYTYKKSGITKTDEDGNTDKTAKVNDDGTLTWKIKVTLGKTADKLTITDTLPKGVTLVSIEGEDDLNSGGTTLAPTTDGAISGKLGFRTVEGTYENGELTVNVTSGDKLAAGIYTLVVNCKVDKDSLADYKAGTTYTFTNSATAKVDDVKIGSADQTQDWTEDVNHEGAKIVDKSVKWDNDSRRVKYSIKLNPYGRDIVEDSEILTLKDVFTYFPEISAHPQGDYSGNNETFGLTAWLVPDSVKLYKGIPDGNGGLTKGEEITNWSWTVKTGVDPQNQNMKTSTLEGKNLPDSTPLILEYDYQLQSQMPPEYETNAGGYKVSNSAVLEGTGYQDDKNGSEVSWGKQETTGAVTSDITGTLYKVSEGNYSKTLPGAKFKLQKYDFDNGYVDVGVTYETDADGKLVIKLKKNEGDVQYEYNVLYRVIETEAPAGYELPADPESNAFYFYFSSKADTSHTLPWNLKELAPNAADLSVASSVFYVENASNNTELTINKKWLNANGDVETGRTGSVRVQLYRRESTVPPTSGGNAKISGTIDTGYVGNPDNKVKQFEEQTCPIGSTVSFTVTCRGMQEDWAPSPPTVTVNGTEITPVLTSTWSPTDPSNPWDTSGQKVYTYTFTVSDMSNVIKGYTQGWSDYSNLTVSDFTIVEAVVGEGQPYGDPVDITSGEGWSKTISDLPAIGKNDAGEKVYYTYYVQEVNGENYDVSYDNNDGIASGTITVTNKASGSPGYELPSTGGPGTTLFTTGGLALMGGALLYGYLEIHRKKREVKRSF